MQGDPDMNMSEK